MLLLLYIPIIVLNLTVLIEASGRRRSRTLGITNTPIFQNESNRDELSYPYLNVYYNFDSKDWNRIREYHSRLLNLKKRLYRLNRQMISDMDRINRFMDIQRNLAINARGKLFQRALSKNVLPTEKVEHKLEPIHLYDQVTNDLPAEKEYFYQPR